MIERPHIKQGQLAEWIPQHADKAPPKATRAGPMFSYFGSKWKGARHFGAPREALVIEQFAGSACYSLRYRAPKVKLYDKYEVICVLWDFLIKCSDKDIADIPDWLPDREAIDRLPVGARELVSFWVGYASTDISRMSLTTYHNYAGRGDCSVWGAGVKARIIKQKPIIKDWEIDCLDYSQIPNERAHWFIDPPYNNSAGAKYIHGSGAIDYEKLAEWCISRRGVVQVAEQEGADWLPWTRSYEVRSASRTGKNSKEVIFERADADCVGYLI